MASTPAMAEAMGWQLPRVNPQSAVYFRAKKNAILNILVPAGIGPGNPAWMTIREDPLEDQITSTAPTCEVFGEKAADLLARGTHRLSTEEEIVKFGVSQKQREEFCAAQTRLAQGQGRTELSMAFVEAMKQINTNGK
jgi:hypothetical protein